MPQFFQMNVTCLSPAGSSVRSWFPSKKCLGEGLTEPEEASKGRLTLSNIKVELAVKLCEDIRLFMTRI